MKLSITTYNSLTNTAVETFKHYVTTLKLFICVKYNTSLYKYNESDLNFPKLHNGREGSIEVKGISHSDNTQHTYIQDTQNNNYVTILYECENGSFTLPGEQG
jgi:hypothetical protein